MAEWLVDGQPAVDLHECDVNRFEPHQLAPGVRRRPAAARTSSRSTTSSTRSSRSETPRPLRTSPFYPRQQELGARTSWRRPAGSARSGTRPTPGLLERLATSPRPNDVGGPLLVADRRRRGAGDPRAVALYDMTALKRLEVTGRGAAASCSGLTTGNVDKSGRLGHLLPAARRRRRDPQRHHRRPARPGPLPGRRQRQPRPRLARAATCRPTAPSRSRDVTAGTCCIGLWGPRARDVAPAADRRRLLERRRSATSAADATLRRARSRSPRCACPTSASSAGSSTPTADHGPEAVGHAVGRPASRTASSPPAAAPSTASGWRRATARSAPT